MPTKWTPANRQMLFWIALQKVKIDPKQIVDNWPIDSEDPPTARAITEQLQIIRKGVSQHGLVNFFNGTIPRSPSKTVRKLENGSPQGPRPALVKGDAKLKAIKSQEEEADPNRRSAKRRPEIDTSRHEDAPFRKGPHVAMDQPNHQRGQTSPHNTLPTPPGHTPSSSSSSPYPTNPATRADAPVPSTSTPPSRKRPRTSPTDFEMDTANDAAAERQRRRRIESPTVRPT